MDRRRHREPGFVARRALLGAPLGLAAPFGLAPMSVAAPAGAQPARPPTPRQALGPFYPVAWPADAGADLTDARPGLRPAGEPAVLSGRVLDTAGRPLAGTRVELWQCNAHGRYHHPRDDGPGPLDPAFRGFGRTSADAEGRFRFRTIRPVAYPGRTPHMHLLLAAPAGTRLVTQVYIRGEPANARDGLLAFLSPDARESLLAPFERDASGTWQATFEAVLEA